MERFVNVELEEETPKFHTNEPLILDKAKCFVYVPYATLDFFEKHIGKLKEMEGKEVE